MRCNYREKFCEGFGKLVQHKFYFLPERLALKFETVALEDGVCSVQDTIYYVEIACGKVNQ